MIQAELAVLFPLVCGPLCTTLSIAAERRQIAPDHPNWFVTEERAWALVEKLYPIDPAEAGARLAASTGLNPYGGHGASPEVLLQNAGIISGHLSRSHIASR